MTVSSNDDDDDDDDDDDGNAFVTAKKPYLKIIPKLLKTVHPDFFFKGLLKACVKIMEENIQIHITCLHH